MAQDEYQPGDSFQASDSQKAALLRGMDTTMVQKLAFSSAHFQLQDGHRILDLGCARGKSSYNLALLNPRLQVIGIDYDQSYIDEARRSFALPNLSFLQGDARNLDFGAEKFHAIFNSSVMHEIYSYSGYSQQAAARSMESQLNALDHDGVILLRDFVRPDQPDAMIYLDVLDQTPPGSEGVSALTPADTLLYYAKIAKALLPEDQRGFYVEETESITPGYRRFYLPHDWAYEFIWRKDYRDRFIPEAEEKYGVWTADQYRSIPESLGARVLYTAPYRNPWLMRNRYEKKVRLLNENAQSLCVPPSNFVALIQKIGEGESQRVREHRISDKSASYLKKTHFSLPGQGAIYDLVSRPGAVFDVIPYDLSPKGRLMIYAKSGYPRPLVNIYPRQMTPNLDGKTWSGHVVEPLAIANQNGSSLQAVKSVLKERAGFDPESIQAIEGGLNYFTAPADVNEKVSSVFVPVKNQPYETALRGQFSKFSSDGTLRAYDAQDLLRGVQVGMLAEGRLEMNIYALMKARGVTPEAWIGDQQFAVQTVENVPVTTLESVQNGQGETRAFKQTKKTAGFLKVMRSSFVEEALQGYSTKVTATQELEFSVPDQTRNGRGYSTNGAVIVPVLRDGQSGEILIGVKWRDFPAVQAANKTSGLMTLPGFRLSPEVRDMDQLQDQVAARYGIDRASIAPLGEAYFPSMGILPNRVFPCVVSDVSEAFLKKCCFVPLRDVFDRMHELEDASLMLAAFRATHALGVWSDYQNKKPAPGPQKIQP